MNSTGNVVRFPSGDTLGASAPTKVSAIAETLHRKLRRRGPLPRSTPQVSVRLDALSGIADDTIRRLALLARAETITPETAARLALRHVRELEADRPSRSTTLRGVPGVYGVHIAGDVPHSFAVRIASTDGGPWIGSAAVQSYGRLLRLCPDGEAICLLIGRAQVGPSSVRLVGTPSWQVTLVGRSMRPAWQDLRHLIVIGGLPADARRKSGITAAIVHQLRSNPTLQLATTESAFVRPGCLADPTTVRILTLLQIAMPGLLRSDQSGSRS